MDKAPIADLNDKMTELIENKVIVNGECGMARCGSENAITMCEATGEACLFEDAFWSSKPFGYNGFHCRACFASEYFMQWWSIEKCKPSVDIDTAERLLSREIPEYEHIWKPDLILLRTLRD